MIRHLLTRRSAFALLAPLAAGLALAGVPAPAAAAAASATATTATSASAGAIDPAAINTRLWMSQIKNVIGDRPLNKIVMPGSHDAGSWSITPSSGVCDAGSEAAMAKRFPGVAANLSVTQYSPIVEQLNSGSRYLDLRLCKQNGQWYTYHGGPRGALFLDDTVTGRKGEINEIAEWLRDHPEEIVTIELRTAAPADSDPSPDRDTAVEDYREAVERLGQAIGTSRMADQTRLSPRSTYNQFMAAGANVVLIDTRSLTNNAWAWPNDRVETRDSYLENKDTVALLNNLLGSPSPYGSAATQLSAQALNQNHKSLRTQQGDPNRLFVLSGGVDSYTMLPQAVIDFANKGFSWNPDELPYMVQLGREHNTNMLRLLEGDWRYSYIAGNTNVVQIDYVNMGGRRADGSIIGSGDMSRAIIANNTPTTKSGVLVGTERRADGSWTTAEPLPGTNASLEYGVHEFGGGERAVTAMPNGDLQVIAYGPDKRLYHNVRRADGSWTGWARPNTDAVDARFPGGPLAITSTPNGDAQLLAIDKDGYLNHNVRRADGSWTGWAAIAGPDSGRFKAKDMAIAALPTGAVKVAAFGADGALRIAERLADGSWDIATKGWQTLPGVGGAPTFAGKDLAMTVTTGNVIQIAAVGNDNGVYWTTRSPSGGLNGPWNGLEWKPNDLMRGLGVSLTALPDGSTQLLAVGMDGNTWHASSGTDLKWSAFGQVPGAYGRPLGANGAAITALPNGSTFTLVGAR
ncbi:hypothetical protein [Streptomyces sp. NPDC087525]|uniref:hypothetical protein n=1 Tax=Streptomyces sp. NPDC087525 TaxID=3365793 RepID=UPI003821D568